MLHVELSRFKKILAAVHDCASDDKDHPAYRGVWFHGDDMLASDTTSFASVRWDAYEMSSYGMFFASSRDVKRLSAELHKHRASDLLVQLAYLRGGMGVYILSRVDPYTKIHTFHLPWTEMEPSQGLSMWRDHIRDRIAKPTEGCSSVGIDPKYLSRAGALFEVLDTVAVLRTGEDEYKPVQLEAANLNSLPVGVRRAVFVAGPVRVF